MKNLKQNILGTIPFLLIGAGLLALAYRGQRRGMDQESTLHLYFIGGVVLLVGLINLLRKIWESSKKTGSDEK